MANRTVHLPVAPLEPLGGTLRKDIWWAGPAATILVLSSFIVYATWRAFEGSAYQWGAYLSPFYSPLLDVGWARKAGLAFLTPAMLILPGPLSFRFTCYYYRKAYYRAFAWDPPSSPSSAGATGRTWASGRSSCSRTWCSSAATRSGATASVTSSAAA